MRNGVLVVLILLFNCLVTSAQDELAPSGTLPVLYINTVDETPIDQRETYVDATAWLDASMTDYCSSLGSHDEPLMLGIRGRGNASWSQSQQKPYKLKFEKKQSPFGFSKSKHFALLHLRGPMTAYFHEPLAFYASRLLGDAWTPDCAPCEVVLNGKYIGLYFLTETVRVEKNRVNIPEQPDMAEDEDIIKSGWLVEIDNNRDTNQVELLEPCGRSLLLTFKSPEILSDAQLDYITSEFNEIISRVHNNEDWLELIDEHSMARQYILQEIMRNYDGFCGSFFFYKDSESKWTAGPAWDFGYSLNEHNGKSFLSFFGRNGRPNLIREMLNSVDFRQIILEEWEDFYCNGTDWVDDVADKWCDKIIIAGEVNHLLWNFSDCMSYRSEVAKSRLKANIEWFNTYVRSEQFNTWQFSDINEIQAISSELEVYDLMGRKIIKPGKGIYIFNGNKILNSVQ